MQSTAPNYSDRQTRRETAPRGHKNGIRRMLGLILLTASTILPSGCGAPPTPMSVAEDLYGEAQYEEAIRYIDQHLASGEPVKRDDKAALLLLKGQCYYNQSDVAFQANDDAKRAELLNQAYATLTSVIGDPDARITNPSVSGAYYVRSRVLEGLGRFDEADADHVAYRRTDVGFRSAQPSNSETSTASTPPPPQVTAENDAATESTEENDHRSLRPRSSEDSDETVVENTPRSTPDGRPERSTHAESMRDRLNQPGQIGRTARPSNAPSSTKSDQDNSPGREQLADDTTSNDRETTEEENSDDPQRLTDPPITRVPSSTYTRDGIPPLGSFRALAPRTGVDSGALGNVPTTGLGTGANWGPGYAGPWAANAAPTTGRASSPGQWSNSPIDPSGPPSTGLTGPSLGSPAATGPGFGGPNLGGATNAPYANPSPGGFNANGLYPNPNQNLPSVGGVGTNWPGGGVPRAPLAAPNGTLLNQPNGLPSAPGNFSGRPGQQFGSSGLQNGLGQNGLGQNGLTGGTPNQPATPPKVSFGGSLPEGFAPTGPKPRPQF